MKFRHLVLTAAAAFTVFGASQASAQTIGFKVGAAFANVSGDDVEDTESLTSLIGGGFVRFGFGGIGIQPELLFVTRGFKVDETDPEIGEVSSKLKLDYIEVPVLAVLPLSMGAGLSPYVFAGPSFAFKLGCKADIEGEGVDISADCDEGEGEDPFKSTDIGATLGAGLEFPMGPGALLVEGRYNFGLTNIAEGEDADVKTRTAAVMAGYSIPLGPRM
jgi:hypothetical protein